MPATEPWRNKSVVLLHHAVAGNPGRRNLDTVEAIPDAAHDSGGRRLADGDGMSFLLYVSE